ncbi:MAG TPA: helix-turn-helix domain-containing protein [Pseudoneobacillus sp.]|nr:helix-turn-helix domain-containing protein [Pseudoneobacillus sp.]
MLGERIRKLRKQKKMTLEALAGKELTKGMLSLIENNKANPSMESLTYIAEQLEVELSDLLDVISSQELRGILELAEKLYNTETSKDHDKYKQLIELIEPHVPNLTQGYEAARLLEIYSYSLYNEKKQGWQETSDQAAKMYDQLNLASNRAAISIFLSKIKFSLHNYSESLEIFLKERKDIESKHVYIDPMTRLDLDYHEAILYFAVGNTDSAIRAMESAITLSKEKRIFYLIDDLYRLATAKAMLFQNEDEKEYYSKKLQQYGEFADHMPSIMFCKLIYIMGLIMKNKDYHKALQEIEQLSSQPDQMQGLDPWLALEKGKALYYLGHYEEALQCLDNIIIPTLNHPFDLTILYVLDSYKALTHFEMGHIAEARTSAKIAVQNYDLMPETAFKEFSLETYAKIYNKA